MRTAKRSWIWRIVRRTVLGVVALTVIPVLCLRWIPPPTSAVMVERRVSGFFDRERQRPLQYHWIGWKSISPQMRLAVVAAEDQKFPRHWGFDFGSIVDAVEHKSIHGRLRGASTITQQVARNLFLWQGRSYLRKGLEAYFTVLLEWFWPKRRTLEVYLNIAEFGDGIYGVYDAAHAFFGKSPAALDQQEAALLAAVLPNPSQLHARNPSPYVRERAAWIEEQMAQLGGPAYLHTL